MATVFIENLLYASLQKFRDSAIRVFHNYRDNARSVLSSALAFAEHPITSTCELYPISLNMIKTKIHSTYESLISNRTLIASNIGFISLTLYALALVVRIHDHVYRKTSVVVGYQVSSFYGPGAWAAWYITIVIKMAESLHQRTIHQAKVWQKPDFNTLTSIAYPFVAFVDAEIQVYRLPYRGGSVSEFLAASYTFTSAIELLIVFCVLRRGASRSRKIRIISGIIYFFISSLSRKNAQGFHTYLQPTLLLLWNPLMAITVAALLLRAWKHDGHRWRTPLLFLLAVATQCASRLWHPPHSVFPFTASRIRDLDQAAALGTMLLLLVYPYSEQTVSVCGLWCSQWWAKFLVAWRLVKQWWYDDLITIDVESLRNLRRTG